MIPYTPPHPAKTIPVIDMTESRAHWEIHKACRETGFFYVSNHGVPQQLIDGQFEHAKRFFALSLEERLAIHMKNSPAAAGYDPLGGQILDSQDAAAEKAPPDLKEGFYFGMELEGDHPYARQRMRCFGHNQWPSALPGFREQMLAYQAAMRGLANRLLAVIALSLELPEVHFVPYYDMPNTQLGVLRYPPHPENAQRNQLGAGAHTDWGTVTLLAQDDLGGLEIRNLAGEWIRATPIPGTFVVNLGDLMQRWTNGLYHSNMHRVKNNSSGRNRHSIAYFYSPRPDARIECLPTCTGPDNPPRFAPCTVRQHLSEMFQRSYGYAA
jgi:isopenicillin N synthase-like dioxygenase